MQLPITHDQPSPKNVLTRTDVSYMPIVELGKILLFSGVGDRCLSFSPIEFQHQHPQRRQTQI
jgi:hypothetical protein